MLSLATNEAVYYVTVVPEISNYWKWTIVISIIQYQWMDGFRQCFITFINSNVYLNNTQFQKWCVVVLFNTMHSTGA